MGAGGSSGGKDSGGLDAPRGEYWNSPHKYKLVTDEEEEAMMLLHLQFPSSNTSDNDPSKW